MLGQGPGMRLVEIGVAIPPSNLNRMIEWTALVCARDLEDLRRDLGAHSGHLLFDLSEEFHQLLVHVFGLLRLSLTLDLVGDTPNAIIHLLIVNAFLILDHFIEPVEEVRGTHIRVDIRAPWDLMAWFVAVEGE